MRYFTFLLISVFLLLSSCEDYQLPFDPNGPDELDCDNPVVENGLFYTDENGSDFLWAGDDSDTHFRVSNLSLDPCKLKYGLGREHFPALITPQYDNLPDVVDDFDDIEKTIILRTNAGTKVYPFSVLVKHELINDIVDGKPIMVVYCFLADLAAVYSRSYCGQNLTFGVSGYTYCDRDISNGLESFVLWDRDTESLWWPINEKAASGLCKGVDMIQHDNSKWEEMRWGDVKTNYPNALVLQDYQTMDPPQNWPSLLPSELICL